MALSVSVIICTRNRCRSLRRALESIADDPSTTPAEIIAVDNSSSDDTAAALEQAAAASSRPFTITRTRTRGLSHARNHGLRFASGELCLFTDDDVTVEAGWIDAIARAFGDQTVGAAGGRVLPRFENGAEPDWMGGDPFFRPCTLWDYGTTSFMMSPGQCPIGANMAIRRSVLGNDPFDTRLGHTGKAALGFEETELFERHIFPAHSIVYVPEAVVKHWLDGSVSYYAVRRKIFQHGVGWQRYRNMYDPLPSYPRRVSRAARGVAASWAASKRTHREGLSHDTARAELAQLQVTAASIETLLTATPRLSQWVATKLV